MLQLRNKTPLSGAIFLLPDQQGIDSLFTVMKGTFGLDGKLRPAEEQVPVALEERYYEEPGSSSIRVPSDVALTKVGTDVLLVGHAYATGDRQTTEMDVSVAIGPLRKTVRVIGDRIWRGSAMRDEMTHPEPFDRLPLVWERAYGGSDRNANGPVVELRNPVGTGFRLADGERRLDGMRLPNLEDPATPIASWKDCPAPACFAPIAPWWEPRRSFAGTYDDKWQHERAPFLPGDFDSRFFQLAPPGLVAPGHLRGDELVEVRGASPGGMLRFRLPGIRVQVTYMLDTTPQVSPARLDLVLIEPDAARVVLLWRAALPCDKKALRVREVRPELAAA
jgi:hypothetical protein